MSIAVRFDNTLSDQLQAERLRYAHGTMAKVDKLVAVLLLAFGVWAVFAVGLKWWTVVWFAVAPLEWFNVLSLRPLQIYVLFKTDPKFREPYSLEFDDSGIHFTTPSIDSKIAWTHYQGMIEDERVFLLLYGKRMHSVIPKRAFDVEEQMSAFREMVKRNLAGG